MLGSLVNTNPNTGIRYGVISAYNVKPEIIDQIQLCGYDLHYHHALQDLDHALAMDEIDETDYETELEILEGSWEDDEPVHEFEIDGVVGRTGWLGGAMFLWIFDSPHTTYRGLCSPCVQNCVDLDSNFNDEGGWLGYDIPQDWRDEE
jgi:hypothetical protein